MKQRSKSQAPARTRRAPRAPAEIEGQNPKANDAPDHDLYHDENRRNMYDPEVGEALKFEKDRER